MEKIKAVIPYFSIRKWNILYEVFLAKNLTISCLKDDSHVKITSSNENVS